MRRRIDCDVYCVCVKIMSTISEKYYSCSLNQSRFDQWCSVRQFVRNVCKVNEHVMIKKTGDAVLLSWKQICQANCLVYASWALFFYQRMWILGNYYLCRNELDLCPNFKGELGPPNKKYLRIIFFISVSAKHKSHPKCLMVFCENIPVSAQRNTILCLKKLLP